MVGGGGFVDDAGDGAAEGVRVGAVDGDVVDAAVGRGGGERRDGRVGEHGEAAPDPAERGVVRERVPVAGEKDGLRRREELGEDAVDGLGAVSLVERQVRHGEDEGAEVGDEERAVLVVRRRERDDAHGAGALAGQEGDAVLAVLEVDGPREDGVEARRAGEGGGLVDAAGAARRAVDLLQGDDVGRERAEDLFKDVAAGKYTPESDDADDTASTDGPAIEVVCTVRDRVSAAKLEGL